MLYPSKYVLITDLDINNKKSNSAAGDNKLILAEKEKKVLKCENHLESSVLSASNSLTFSDGIQKSSAGIMPERVWQDIVMNPAYTFDKSEHKMKIENFNENNRENSINIANSNNNNNNVENSIKTQTESATGDCLWNFVEPCLKNSCGCKR